MSSSSFPNLSCLSDPFSCFIRCLKVGNKTNLPFGFDAYNLTRQIGVARSFRNGIADCGDLLQKVDDLLGHWIAFMFWEGEYIEIFVIIKLAF